MTVRRLEDFACSIGAAVGLAQHETRSETRVTAMDVDLAATVELLDPREGARMGAGPGALALRIGRPPDDGDDNYLRLSIGVRGERGEQVEVRLEGRLLGRYGKRAAHGEAK